MSTEAEKRLEAAQYLAKYVFGTVHGALLPQTICDHGEGVYLFDQEGKRYIDFSGGPHVVSADAFDGQETHTDMLANGRPLAQGFRNAYDSP